MKKNIYKDFYPPNKRLDLSATVRVKSMADIINGLNPAKTKILDIGCYDGTLLSLIGNENNELHGIEANGYGVAESQKKGINIKNFFFDDISSLPFENNFFDIVIAGEIIEHIYDTDFFLSEIRRVLKRCGFFLVSTPNIASLGRRLMLFLGRNPIIEVSPNQIDSSGHIRYFTFKTLENLLKKHGFGIILKKSDVINLSVNGRLKSSLLAKFFPALGQSLIYLCTRKGQ